MATVPGSTRYGMLERGWEHVIRSRSICGYVGPAPVSLESYAKLIRLQSLAAPEVSKETIQAAFSDLVLPETLLQTLGYVATSRRSLFLTGIPGTGKTAIAERINAALPGTVWIPYAIEIDGQIIRVFDAHTHRPVEADNLPLEYDRRWICIERPLVIVGGELELEDTNLAWSETAQFYEAPFQMKANGGTLVIDDFGRQRVEPHKLLNRWIVPLERRMDYLTLQTGKKIEVPFEQLVVFSTNLEEKDLVDEAFLRRMGYRARIEPPTLDAYVEIFKRTANARGIRITQTSLEYLLQRYWQENRQMKACEPRDLLERVRDICLFEGLPMVLTSVLIDSAWQNYFGAAHSYAPEVPADSLQILEPYMFVSKFDGVVLSTDRN